MENMIKSLQDVVNFAIQYDDKIVSESVTNAIEFGEIEALKIIIALHKLSSIATNLRKNASVLGVIDNESAMYNNKYQGFKIGFQYRKEFDFKACNDPFFNELEAQKRHIENELQQRKEFLKLLTCEASDAKSEGVVISPPKITTQKVLTLTKL